MEYKKRIKELKEKKTDAEKKLKRKQIEQKAQQKVCCKKSKVLAELKRDHPEVAEQISKLDVHHGELGRPSVESTMPGLHHEILSIVIPASMAEERRRSKVYDTVRSLDDLKCELEKRGYHLARTTLYYRLLPKNAQHRDGKRHVKTVPVKLSRHQSNLRKKHMDSHFAMASVKHAREFASLFSKENVFFLSQDDKARVPLGLLVSKKQTAILMHLEYKVSLPDHDFPIGGSPKLIPSVYASCLQKEDQSIGYSGPTFTAIRSGKHDKSCAASHMEDFRSLIQAEEFQTACKNGDNIKPLVFVSVDGGPDEAPKNTQALAAWTKDFTDFDFDCMCLFTHAAGSSAYNPVERRMAPLSKDTAGVILPFDTYGNHLNNSNKTVDEDLEKENFKAAGEILAKNMV